MRGGKSGDRERAGVDLTDDQARVYAAYQMGGVVRELVRIRGCLVERFILGGDDVTQIVTILERRNYIDTRRGHGVSEYIADKW